MGAWHILSMITLAHISKLKGMVAISLARNFIAAVLFARLASETAATPLD